MSNILRKATATALVVAAVCWLIAGVAIQRADAANGYLVCITEDSRACIYDAQHPRFGNDFAPYSFFINDSGVRVWRLPHRIAHHMTAGTRRDYRPCPTEDSIGCVWRGDVRGNRTGNSYWTGWHGRVWLLPHHLAYRLVTS